MELTEQFILLQAPSPAAAANGRKLSQTGRFSALRRTGDRCALPDFCVRLTRRQEEIRRTILGLCAGMGCSGSAKQRFAEDIFDDGCGNVSPATSRLPGMHTVGDAALGVPSFAPTLFA